MKKLTALFLLFAFVLTTGVHAGTEAAKEWTIMIFLNGDNNLEGAGIDDVNEMEKVGSTDKIDIVCQFDRRSGYDSSNGDWTDTKIFHIEKDNDMRTITSPVVKELGEVNMGDGAEVVKFVKYCKENYPAKRYFLSIWNHGASWDIMATGSQVVKGISYDDSNGHAYMDAFELSDVAKQIKSLLGKNLDIMDFDACLMAMPCIGYQMMPYVDIMVASEETEPGDGKPYDDYLAALAKNPAMGAAEFSKIVVDKYAASYSGGSQGSSSTTQSATDLSKLVDLADAVKVFSGELIANLDKVNEIKAAYMGTQDYAMAELKDLVHFAKLVSGKVPALKTSAGKVIAAVNAAIIANKVTGYGLNNSFGLAAYMPTSYGYKKNYKDLAWSRASDWNKFLEAYFVATSSNIAPPADDVVFGQLNYIARKNLLGHDTSFETAALTGKFVDAIDNGNLTGVTTLAAFIKTQDLDTSGKQIMSIVKKVSEKLTNSYLENRSKKIQALIDSLK